MNIFRILSANDGHIYEPSITSFLAYLLDPQNDHGMGYELILSMIRDCQQSCCFRNLDKNLLAYSISVETEYPVYTYDGVKKDIDIVIKFSKGDGVKYILCIENKIRDSSLDDKQLFMEREGIENEFAGEAEVPEICFCFLTLKPSVKSAECFDKFKSENKFAYHLFWIPCDYEYASIYQKLQKILERSNVGEIDPLSSDIRFLTTSFLVFISKGFKSENVLKAEMADARERMNYGKPVIEYIRECADSLEFDKEILVADVKRMVTEKIERQSGISPNKTTVNCQMTASIVNNRGRIHYNVSKRNQQTYNVFYYPNENDHSVVCRYVDGETQVNQIYLK